MTFTVLIQLTRCDLLSDWLTAGQGLIFFFFKLDCLSHCYVLYMIIPP